MEDQALSQYHALPQPDEIPVREREDAMGSYLMMFAAMGAGLPLPIINLIAALVYYYLNKSNSRFVRFHSLQALLSQIPTTLMNAILLFWSVRIYFSTEWELSNNYFGYLAAVIIANLLYIIFGIIGAIKARKGKFYYLMFFGKLCYHQVFLIRATENTNENLNQPPRM